MGNPKNPLKEIAILILVMFTIQLVNVATGMHLMRFGITDFVEVDRHVPHLR